MIGKVEVLARGRPEIRGIGLVGSWARGRPRAGSDLDLLILSSQPEQLAKSERWLEELGAAEVIRRKRWGVVEERRVRLLSGLEVELDIAPTSWARTEPLDPGTRDVVNAGLRILYDPEGLLGRVEAAAEAACSRLAR